MNINDLLKRVLNQELLVAVQMAYFAGVIETPSLKKHFLDLAYQELEHFSRVASNISEINASQDIEALRLKIEKNELKALITLEAMEDTLIHYYAEMLSPACQIKEPMRSRLKNCLEDERKHKEQMTQLLKEAKENIKRKANPSL